MSLGTFSTVYKAIDVRHYQKDNSAWVGASRQDPFDVARLLALFMALQKAIPTRARKKVINSRLNQCIKEYIRGHYLGGSAADEIDEEALRQSLEARPPIFVAIKRINATSGPRRIAEEMKFLRDLQGLHHVVPVVTASRWEDQVVVVSPFFHGIDFRDLLPSLTVRDIAGYMRLLLEALAHVHEGHIMHRDIKPSNFLFAREGDGTYRGLLVDFGLAQVEEQDASKRAKTAGRKTDVAACPEGLRGLPLRSKLEGLAPGHVSNDPRAQMKASRAGTRGFRAPEVLFKVAHQTVAIDIWSVGVILLTMLTRRYPFFQSTDDMDALVELATIFGAADMANAARSYDRVWTCNVPTVPPGRVCWRQLCARLNPSCKEFLPDEVFDLLDRLLDLDFRTRITALGALDHPFLLQQ